MIGRRTLAAAVLGLAAASCGDEPTAEDRRAELIDQLAADLVAESDGAIDREAARCVAERLADDVGVERFDEVVAAAQDTSAEGDVDEGLRDEVVDAFAACDALDPLLED